MYSSFFNSFLIEMNLLFPITDLFIEKTASTNSFLAERKQSYKNWTVLTTPNQTNGRAYADNMWSSNSNENLTFSLLIKPQTDKSLVFYLNKLVANAVHQSVSNFTKSSIKWPNDIIINHKKMCGILVENTFGKNWNYAIIGIGMNVNQTNFNDLPKATSLAKELGYKIDIEKLRLDIINNIQIGYQNLLDNQIKTIDHYFHNNLYKKDQISVFKINDTHQNGIIRGTSPNGELIIEFEDADIKLFRHKEIQLMY